MYLKDALGLGSGYVLSLSRNDVRDLFLSCSVDVENDERFQRSGTSMGKRMGEFLTQAENSELACVLGALCDLPESSFAEANVTAAEFRAQVQTMMRQVTNPSSQQDSTDSLHKPTNTGSLVALAERLVVWPIFTRVEPLLRSNHQQHAVEEAFKLVRERLRLITGKERASDVFGSSGQSDKFYKEIFGIDTPFKDLDERVRDQCVGVAHTQLAIQNYRNVLFHTPYAESEERQTLQYLVLASHAFESISNQLPLTVASEVKRWAVAKRMSYPNAAAFYREFENLRWAADFPGTMRRKLKEVERPVLDLFIELADFTSSYNTSNIWLMCFQLVSEQICSEDLRKIKAKPTIDPYGNDQMAGWDEFLRFIGDSGRGPQ